MGFASDESEIDRSSPIAEYPPAAVVQKIPNNLCISMWGRIVGQGRAWCLWWPDSSTCHVPHDRAGEAVGPQRSAYGVGGGEVAPEIIIR